MDVPHPGGSPIRARKRPSVPQVIGALVLGVLVLQGLLSWRASSRVNKVALVSQPKPVTVVEAKAATYRPSRAYVGTLQPWVAANVGPQLVSAYVDTVLVRPGASVRRGEILATLDCRDVTASSKAVAMQARALEEEQRAVADEARRSQSLLDGGFISGNEVERQSARSLSAAASLEATKAKLQSTQFQVDDCILRAPFNGEVATRDADPGAFVRPGSTIVSIVDRGVIRFATDVPEADFGVVAPATLLKLRVLATGKEIAATVSRRAPAADPGTRTVHFEADIPDSNREIPVGTTAEAFIDVGEPLPVTEVPLFTASVRGPQATIFVVEGDTVHRRTLAVKGESGGSLYLPLELAAGSQVVSEGQALLEDGDKVSAKPLTGAGPEGAAKNVAAGEKNR